MTHGEPNTVKIANTDNKKSQSSDKLKKSSLPSYLTSRFTSKRDHPTDLKNYNSFLSINNFCCPNIILFLCIEIQLFSPSIHSSDFKNNMNVDEFLLDN